MRRPEPPLPPPPDTAAIGSLRHAHRWQTHRHVTLVPTAVAQSGVLSRAQLAEHGLSHGEIEHEIEAGRWRSVGPTVVALHNGQLDRAQVLWLAVLHAGPRAAISHITACELAGLRWTAQPLVHVLAPKGDLASPVPGVFFHQTRRRYDGWVVRDGGVPRIGPPHALLLTAERDHNLRRAIGPVAAGVQQGLAEPERLAHAVVEIRKLRHRQPILLALDDMAGGAASFAEIDAGRVCHEAGLVPPTRQARRRDSHGKWRYLDLEWVLPDGRIVVLEVDGSFHMLTENWAADMKRERAVVLTGRTVLRCSTVELRLEPAAVLADLAGAGIPRFVCDRPA